MYTHTYLLQNGQVSSKCNYSVNKIKLLPDDGYSFFGNNAFINGFFGVNGAGTTATFTTRLHPDHIDSTTAGTYQILREVPVADIENYLSMCYFALPNTILVSGQTTSFYDEGVTSVKKLNIEKYQMTDVDAAAEPCPTIQITIDQGTLSPSNSVEYVTTDSSQ